KIDRSDSKARALSSIVSALAEKGNFGMATKVAKKIDRSDSKARALSSIAASQSATDKESAAKTFEMATKVVEGMYDSDSKARALSSIVSALAEKGNFGMATKVVEGIDDYYDKARALSSIAASQSATDKESAAKTFEMATKVAKKIDDYYDKAEALSSIAASQSATDKESAAKTFEMATKVAKKIDRSHYKARALSSIVSAQIRSKSGLDALKTIKLVTHRRNIYLYEIARLFSYSSDKENFKLLLPECKYYPDTAYMVCALLCFFYPEKIMQIKSLMDVNFSMLKN
ncbi:MAG: hypothetical protein OEW49_06575, partial [Nitrosopumilus sp.]|nr:hypothetical protein [Nitrosopumilus sp.]